MRIFIEDSFDSAHSLPHLPDGHKCRQIHGHTYRVRLEFEGEVNPQDGFVLDYDIAKAQWSAVKVVLDHRNLNEVIKPFSTCEYIAQFIAIQFAKIKDPGVRLARIELRETERCGVVLDINL